MRLARQDQALTNASALLATDPPFEVVDGSEGILGGELRVRSNAPVVAVPDQSAQTRLRFRPRNSKWIAISLDALIVSSLLALLLESREAFDAVALASVVVALVLAKGASGHYRRDRLRLKVGCLEQVAPALQMGAVAAFAFVLIEASHGASIPALMLMQIGFVVTLGQLMAGFTRHRLATRLCAAERLMVVGPDEAAKDVRRHLKISGFHAFTIVGRFTDVPTGRVAELVRQLEAERVIIIRGSDDDGQDSMRTAHQAQAAGARVSIFTRDLAMLGSSFEVEQVGASVAVHAHARPTEPRSKRIFDVVCASLGLIVLAPFFALIAALIKFESGGSVFFTQQRVGRDGRKFAMVKFRSMVPGAERLRGELLHRNEASGGLFKLSHDPRVTHVGRFLRRTSLDELPQLLNVLKGEMSLVGPRPLVPEEDSRVTGWRRDRLSVRPGMTGPWQVMGSARIGMEDMTVLDNTYVTDWTIGYDVRMLLRTAAFVLSARGL